VVHVRRRDGWVWDLGNVSQDLDEDFPPAALLQDSSQSLVDPVGGIPLPSKGWRVHFLHCCYFMIFYRWEKSSGFMWD